MYHRISHGGGGRCDSYGSITGISRDVLQSAVNGIGSDAVASVTAGSKLSMLTMCPFDAMGSTMAVYGGQTDAALVLRRGRSGHSQ